MKSVMEISPVGRYAILAIFGAVFGILASIIFLLVYYGQRFGMPVPDSMRMKSALVITIVICMAIVVIYFRNTILDKLRVPDEFTEDDLE